MIKCDVCNRQFKNKRALGGHMSNAHPKQPGGGASEGRANNPAAVRESHAGPPGEASPAESADTLAVKVKKPKKSAPKAAGQAGTKAVVAGKPQEVSAEGESEAERIKDYFQKGYTFNQLTSQLGFKAGTVRQELEKLVPPEKGGDESLPVVRKMGGGMDIITPEALLRRYMDGDSDKKELRGIMKMRAAMLMVMDLVDILEGRATAQAKLIEPILKLMRESRDEQDAAALRARASVDEAAKKAADDTAGRLAEFLGPRLEALETKKPDIATTPNPMAGVMARTMETLMSQMLSKLGLGSGPGGQSQAPTGFTYEKQKEVASNG